ncbi:transmembrane protein 62 [Anoplophora glabripennis]|uniref:transmembrane protein 62 n=1 Tax=Anoplophora glabripennis TaxID=217634 RepID=UPI000874E4B7|nr:transmembrane protein 62 [Anoplophora glabripennis]
MRLSKLSVGIVLSMIIFSIFFTNVVNLLSTDTLNSEKDIKKNYIKITDTPDNLIWFLQISDLHISIFRDPFRITEFREFCHYTLDAIKPRVVLASGDLTDAKTKDAIGSDQFEGEWKYYRDILAEAHVKRKTLWLDIRGNHDNFNVINNDSKQNFFTNYSVQGKEHPRSYMYQIKQGGTTYSFIGIDACLEPGPRRPFNFVGILDELEVNEINSLIKKAESVSTNYTVWFGHFPTSCILTPGPENVRDLIGKHKQGLVYVCGHLHKLGGLIPQMYTLQKAGFLELEVGDWKDNRMYRLMAIDHGLLSFVDIPHRDWPVALITNPKHALFVNLAKENLDKLRNSTHIRVLAFSLANIDFVKVKVDDGPWIRCKNIKGPLYAADWNPKLYLKGIHTIEVYVKDTDGRIKTVSQPFSLDGTPLSFSILSRVALMTDASLIFKLMFFSMLVLSITPLCVVRYLHYSVTAGRSVKPRMGKYCWNRWLRKLWVLSTIDRLFWPVIIYPVYLAFGPWSVGYIVEDYIGVIFAWGIFVNGAYLPGSFTYAYGFIQLFTFQLPLMLIIANLAENRFQELTLKPGKKLPIKRRICLHLPFLIVFCLQVSMAYLFWLAYGTLAFLLGPLRTWSLILAAVLYYQALNLPEKCIRRAAEVWQTPSETLNSDVNPIEKEN